MDDAAGSTSLIMPHEDIDRPKEKVAFSDRISFLKTVFFDLLRMRFSAYERKIDICQELFNGPNAGTIHKKFDFIEQVRKLGYRGPEQVLFTPGQNGQLTQALQLLEKHGRVFCKPKDGQQGIGIFLCNNAAELQSRLSNAREAYIVQEQVPPLTDYRYVYHIDPEVTYRFCYKKVRPSVYGNGKDNLGRLIKLSADLPEKSKEKLAGHLSKTQLASVPGDGERVELVDSGNISKGAYGTIVTGKELAALDKVMLALIKDLQHYGKLEITTFCFDLGVLRADITPENVTREDYVLYEYQIPFGLNGYISAPEVKEQGAKVARMFMGSLQRSWISRQKNGYPITSESEYLGS